MAALGALINSDRSYIDISTEVRQFSARIVGPSLDLLGTSIELLKLEGLIEVVENSGGDGAELLRLTKSGLQELKEYLKSTIRSGSSDLNKLVVALKLRFIEVLEPHERLDQLVGLQAMYQAERNRLQDLRKHKEWSAGLLPGLLDLELAVTDQRLSWCGKQVEKIEKIISLS